MGLSQSDLDARAVPIGGLAVIDAENDALADFMVDRMAKGDCLKVAFFNSNMFIKLRQTGWQRGRFSDFLFLNDGIAASAAAALVSGRFFKHNLNGTDFTPLLLRKLRPGTKVFLYGARPDAVATAAEVIGSKYGHDVVGYIDGYSYSPEEAARQVTDSGAEVVLVALGNPLQEMWIADYADRVGADMVLGVGALFDFLSERVQRAPAWMRRYKLEWAYRLLGEPRRLLKRYTIEVTHFFWIVLRDRHRPALDGIVWPFLQPQKTDL